MHKRDGILDANATACGSRIMSSCEHAHTCTAHRAVVHFHESLSWQEQNTTILQHTAKHSHLAATMRILMPKIVRIVNVLTHSVTAAMVLRLLSCS